MWQHAGRRVRAQVRAGEAPWRLHVKIIAENLSARKAGAASVGANMGEMLRAFDGMQQKRFNKIEADMLDVSARQDQAEVGNRALRVQL